MLFRKIKIVFPPKRELWYASLLILVLSSLYGFLVLQRGPGFTGLADILKSGRMTVIMQSRFDGTAGDARRQPSGFEYDLVKAFADDLGVTLSIRTAASKAEATALLKHGNGAIIASGIPIADSRRELIFSKSYRTSQQCLVLHRDNAAIAPSEYLNGKVIHVQQNFHDVAGTTNDLNKKLPARLRTVENISAGELIRRVADGSIDAAVTDRLCALRYRRYYPQIVIAMMVNEAQPLGWAVHPNARMLRFRINAFLKKTRENGMIEKLYHSYYANLEEFDYVELMRYHRSIKAQLPRYLDIIRSAASTYHFDWRLIAAQMYQESHFNPLARSYAGAVGLMQLTPATAAFHGVTDILDPAQNIYAGVSHLRNLYELFDSARGTNRLLLALGAYNIGQGHLRDVQNLARRLNLDPNQWFSLSSVLPLIQKQQFYEKSRYGYCRGSEALNYTKKIMLYYDILKHKCIEPVIREEKPRLEEKMKVGPSFMAASDAAQS